MTSADYYKNLTNNLLNNEPSFNKSQQTLNSYNALTNLENNKPGEYKSAYQGDINNLINKYQNDKFTYNKDNDPAYLQAYGKYTTEGKNAMEDTMGNYASNTGGYNNSYAQAAGQKQYNNYIDALSNKLTSLQKTAYNNWNNQRNDTLQQISLLQGLDDTQYTRYRDTVSDYFNFLDYYNQKYSNDLNFDMQKFQNELSNWQTRVNSAQSAYQFEANYAQQQNQFNAQQQYNYAQLLQQQKQFDDEMKLKYAQLR